ncbi:hypothetical protein Y032_0156g3099 [Ancylostoma ceylanicum]|uniref:G protein gamma domain-containing protein n=1 Tax=Ancylostoma ceylanicum TaxID=53326 RepID=A0A016SZF6_9BILA|nr:hypothetical protein Y032_0156g3099 [Ancylostoma ceylanicum]
MPRFADLPEPVMDKSDMQRSVDSLRSQLNIERTPISQSATELRRYTETQEDPLVNPIDKKVNPWAEKSKCSVL